MRQSTSMLQRQGGVVLMEVLVAVLVFSFGILGMISLQAMAIRNASDAKLRTEASYLVGQMISQMWVDRAKLADYSHMVSGSTCTFTGAASSATAVTDWIGDKDKAGTVNGTLPGASAQIKADNATGLVSVTVCWKAPQESEIHNFTTSALISG